MRNLVPYKATMRRIRIMAALLMLLGSSATAFAASERCSGNGFSVWCHRFVFGYTKCNLYDRNGDLVSDFVDPDTACQSIK